MPGMYTYFVAYTLPSLSVTLCNTAVIGTPFIRDEPLADNIEIYSGSTATLSVPHVHAVDTIGGIQDINLRLSNDSEFTSIQFINGATAAEVTIDATGLAVGTYYLKLESFGKHDGEILSLKTDTITISVLQLALEPVVIVSGVEKQWSLPKIFAEATVRFKHDFLISAYLSYDTSLNKMSYNGKQIAGLHGNKYVKSTITLLNPAGVEESLYKQVIFIYPGIPATTLPISSKDGDSGQKDQAFAFADADSNQILHSQVDAIQAQQFCQGLKEDNLEVPSVKPPPRLKRNQTTEDFYDSLAEMMDRATQHTMFTAGLSKDEQDRVPSATLSPISKNGEVVITFSQEIDFPLEILVPIVKSESSQASEETDGVARSQDGEPYFILEECFFTLQMMLYETETISENLTSWQISSVTSTEMRIKLDFSESIEVSQDDERDQLLVFANLSNFKNKNGIPFPEFIFLNAELPPQNPSWAIADMLKSLSETVSYTVAACLSFKFILDHSLNSSMSKLWGMLNSLQTSVYFPMFERVNFPNNAQVVNSALVKVATFDVVDTGELIDSHLVTWEEGSPFSSNFEECGVETIWFLNNSSVILWIYSLNFAMFIVYLLFKQFQNRCGVLRTRVQKLQGYFFFNGVIRLFMETFLDLYLTSFLNIVTQADSETSSTLISVNNYVALGVFVLFNVLVVVLLVVSIWKFAEFKANSSIRALFDGTRIDQEERSKWLLLFPALFFGRRIAFTLSVLLIRYFIWAQLTVQFAFSIAMLIYLIRVRPLETPFANNIEVYNECTNIFLTYGLMCFTTFVPDPKTRFFIGWQYTGVSCVNVLVHLTIIVVSGCKQLFKWCRRKYYLSNGYILKKQLGHDKSTQTDAEVPCNDEGDDGDDEDDGDDGDDGVDDKNDGDDGDDDEDEDDDGDDDDGDDEDEDGEDEDEEDSTILEVLDSSHASYYQAVEQSLEQEYSNAKSETEMMLLTPPPAPREMRPQVQAKDIFQFFSDQLEQKKKTSEEIRDIKVFPDRHGEQIKAKNKLELANEIKELQELLMEP